MGRRAGMHIDGTDYSGASTGSRYCFAPNWGFSNVINHDSCRMAISDRWTIKLDRIQTVLARRRTKYCCGLGNREIHGDGAAIGNNLIVTVERIATIVDRILHYSSLLLIDSKRVRLKTINK